MSAEGGNDARARFRSVMDHVDHALDLPEDQHPAYIEGEVEPALRDEVRRLLAADAQGSRILSEVAAARLPSALSAMVRRRSPSAEAGTMVGPFRLVARLGAGGMGEVWTADRVGADFEQRVAVKLLYGGRDAEAAATRFRRERRILAKLSHPHIARLLDGGVTDDGQPWLAMDLVRGEDLVRHAALAKLDVDARLALFVEVCDSVAFAHRNLVIHRDLKPSNILVDEDGEPKLLDFGIAKLLEDDTDDAPLTAVGERAMTPDYASPEQIRGEPVTTASDVWSLGAILNELLTGARVDRSALGTAKGKPSAQLDAGDEAVHQRRPAGPRHVLARRLRGDLDAIVSKALRADLRERYASVEAFAADVRRHQAGLPVTARGEATSYVVHSFVKRHRVAVALSGFAILGLVLGLLGTLWQTHRAREEARKASETQQFLVALLQEFDPYERAGKPVTQRDILLRGEARVAELGGEPEVQAELLRVFARTWLNMGELERAKPTAERALALQRGTLGPRSLEVAKTLIVLGDVAYTPGDSEAAGRAYDEALSIARQVEGPAGATAPEALGDVAAVARARGDFATSETLYREQRDRYGRRFGPESREALEAMGDLAAMLCDAGRLDESEALTRNAARLDAKVYGPDHPGTLIVQANLGRVLVERGSYDEAEKLLAGVYARQSAAMGPTWPFALNALRTRARALDGLGRSDQAVVILDEVLHHQEELRGRESVEVARTLEPAVPALRHLGRLVEAEAAARRALAIQSTRPGEPHTTARLRALLGGVLLDEGHTAEAAEELARALVVEERLLAPTHHDLLATRAELARAHAR